LLFNALLNTTTIKEHVHFAQPNIQLLVEELALFVIQHNVWISLALKLVMFSNWPVLAVLVMHFSILTLPQQRRELVARLALRHNV